MDEAVLCPSRALPMSDPTAGLVLQESLAERMRQTPMAPRLKLGPRCRLRTRAQLEWIRQHGQKDAAPLCVVAAVCPPPDGAARVVFVVSRRYSPKAVVRNRARRLLREAYRHIYPALRPAWLVLIPRMRLQRARMPAVLSDMHAACGRLGLLT